MLLSRSALLGRSGFAVGCRIRQPDYARGFRLQEFGISQSPESPCTNRKSPAVVRRAEGLGRLG